MEERTRQGTLIRWLDPHSCGHGDFQVSQQNCKKIKWTHVGLKISLAGVVLEKYVEEYKGVALLTPVLIGLAGNLGSIYASRISTCLHCETKEDYKLVEFTLLIMNIPVQVVFLIIIWAFHMGQLNYNFWFCLAYFCVSMICVSMHSPQPTRKNVSHLIYSVRHG